MIIRKFPIGIQDFENLRQNNFLYVDKTAYIYRLASEGNPYFLGRPRRFGKSLLISTIKAYFLGKRELFEGLAIAQLEKEWVEYPVFHFDMNVENYIDSASLELALDSNLRPLEEIWGRDDAEISPASRFLGLLRRASEKTGKRVVVLIDEYDKPLLGTMDNLQPHEDIRNLLKAFYGILKTADPYLHFVLLTGVTKFSKVSIFSDLNHLRDISMDRAYAGICGITAAELAGNFEPELNELAKINEMTYKDTLAKMKRQYDGYHFAKESEGIFNPFSVLNVFANKEFRNYWFQTGTPTFLVKMLKQHNFDVRDFSDNITISANSITDYRMDGGNIVPLLYQTGYLTIKGYNRQFDAYILGFPNEEVEYGFLNELLPAYVPCSEVIQDFFVMKFIEDLQAGNVDAFMTRIRAFFADIPYELNDKTERHYQTLFYLVFKLMGQFVQVELRSARGRADAVVIVQDTVYVFEFKLSENATAEDALRQIDEKGYLIPFIAGERKVVKIGAEFNTAERTLSRWVYNGV
ncbi:MAG: hypothetical protein EZS26_002458 [Candidatus Ordinivivax streblomastigis]|uniref:AAA-ATPase-like domain-containing protein n=1 Tax=Candidatus Ordinivivax streblomastigis TaxID=2540710 RepID=A0A5M8NYY9_9BACT|nr:MAG: hypothetical protein EZS26_002458 [Candidatus Ordinivivax streblomastigis]